MLYTFSKYWYQCVYLFRIVRDWNSTRLCLIYCYMKQHRPWRLNFLPTSKNFYNFVAKKQRTHNAKTNISSR